MEKERGTRVRRCVGLEEGFSFFSCTKSLDAAVMTPCVHAGCQEETKRRARPTTRRQHAQEVVCLEVSPDLKSDTEELVTLSCRLVELYDWSLCF